jgi:hypothetical protein
MRACKYSAPNPANALVTYGTSSATSVPHLPAELTDRLRDRSRARLKACLVAPSGAACRGSEFPQLSRVRARPRLRARTSGNGQTRLPASSSVRRSLGSYVSFPSLVAGPREMASAKAVLKRFAVP